MELLVVLSENLNGSHTFVLLQNSKKKQSISHKISEKKDKRGFLSSSILRYFPEPGSWFDILKNWEKNKIFLLPDGVNLWYFKQS